MKKVVRSRRWNWIRIGLAWLGLPALVCAQYPDGIYAEFQTSLGNFTNRLEYTLAPKAVANFIGLATGQRSWLDLTTGVTRTNPFYHGTTFHRVIANFMIQGGSPNGQGTDGPGYSFVDEFTPALRHDTFGTLSCANSGPDSNGSQFFVTAAPTPWLDDVHTVFGKLYGGSNAVYAISRVSTGANDKPLTNVIINNVIIRRVGPAAQAFSLHGQGLASLTNLTATIARGSGGVNLSFSNRLNVENWLYHSTNLTQWTGAELGLEVGTVSGPSVFRNASLPREFFRLAQAQYPHSLHVPRFLTNRTLVLTFDGGTPVITYHFNGPGTGTYTWTGGSGGAIAGYNWLQSPHRGRLLPIVLSGVIPMNLHLDFDAATLGTFKGTALPNYPSSVGAFSVGGTFTSTP